MPGGQPLLDVLESKDKFCLPNVSYTLYTARSNIRAAKIKSVEYNPTEYILTFYNPLYSQVTINKKTFEGFRKPQPEDFYVKTTEGYAGVFSPFTFNELFIEVKDKIYNRKVQ